VFNVADPAVVGGAILLVALSLFGYDFDAEGRRRPDGAAKPDGAGSPAAESAEADLERD
jgi:signal peptidase II